MSGFLRGPLRLTFLAWVVASTVGCGSEKGSSPSGEGSDPIDEATDAPRNYTGTASVGDFLNVLVDPEASTIEYENVTNGQSGTVPYTVLDDGSYAVDDPAGNLLAAIELPGYALVMDLDHAGPEQDTRSFAFGIEQAPISVDDFSEFDGNMMQFRTSSGGMEVGCLSLDSDATISGGSYWPSGALDPQGEAFIIHDGDLGALEEDPSGFFLTAASQKEGEQPSRIFATPSGILAIDNPNGNHIIFAQAESTAFDSAWAGDFAALVYDKTQANTGSDNLETGNASVEKRTVTVDARGTLEVRDAEGASLLGGSLIPLVDSDLVGEDKIPGPCEGLFTFRVTEDGREREVFAAFVERALLVASFRPNEDGSYDYFYGAGLRR